MGDAVVVQVCRQPTERSSEPVVAGVGITASREGRQSARNRVRRRLRVAREVLRQHGMTGCDYVLIGRAATLSRPFPAGGRSHHSAQATACLPRRDRASGGRATGFPMMRLLTFCTFCRRCGPGCCFTCWKRSGRHGALRGRLADPDAAFRQHGEGILDPSLSPPAGAGCRARAALPPAPAALTPRLRGTSHERQPQTT